MFLRVGMQFESHLGHDIFPRQGRFCFDVLTKLVVALADGLVRGLWPGRRGGLFRCGVAVSVPWLVGSPPAVAGFLRFLVPVLSGWAGVAYTYSWTGGARAT